MSAPKIFFTILTMLFIVASSPTISEADDPTPPVPFLSPTPPTPLNPIPPKTPPTVSPSVASEAVNQVVVSSISGWQATPLALAYGSIFEVSQVTGSWTIDYRNYGYVGAGGYSLLTDLLIFQGCKYDSSVPYGRLLGRVGTSGPVFSVGTGGIFTANSSGTLYLRINDSDLCLDDNAGSINASVASPPANPNQPDSITMSFSSSSLGCGGGTQVTAWAFTQSGAPVPNFTRISFSAAYGRFTFPTAFTFGGKATTTYRAPTSGFSGGDIYLRASVGSPPIWVQIPVQVDDCRCAAIAGCLSLTHEETDGLLTILGGTPKGAIYGAVTTYCLGFGVGAVLCVPLALEAITLPYVLSNQLALNDLGNGVDIHLVWPVGITPRQP